MNKGRFSVFPFLQYGVISPDYVVKTDRSNVAISSPHVVSQSTSVIREHGPKVVLMWTDPHSARDTT